MPFTVPVQPAPLRLVGLRMTFDGTSLDAMLQFSQATTALDESALFRSIDLHTQRTTDGSTNTRVGGIPAEVVTSGGITQMYFPNLGGAQVDIITHDPGNGDSAKEAANLALSARFASNLLKTWTWFASPIR
jgi:hypothetical protein